MNNREGQGKEEGEERKDFDEEETKRPKNKKGRIRIEVKRTGTIN